jgi:hypothetical protein
MFRFTPSQQLGLIVLLALLIALAMYRTTLLP